MALTTGSTECGAQKIYKMTKKLKFLQCVCPPRRAILPTLRAGLGTLLVLAVFALKPLHARALPVSIGWQVPLTGSHSYQLEVASDPGFAHIVLNATATGRSYNWDAPSEGVYHWRLLRIGKTSQSQEASTFVSGSFIAVDPSLERARPAKISWDPVDGADRYKIYAIDRGGKARTMLAMSNSFVLPKIDSPVMLELVPYSGGGRTYRDYHYNPSLKWDSGIDTPQPKAEIASAPVTEAPSPAIASEQETSPVSQEPAPTAEPETPPAEPAVTEETPEPDDHQPAVAAETAEKEPEDTGTKPRRRLYQLSFFLFHGQEKLRLQKLEVLFSSLERVTGAGASLWINPVSGLVVSGSGWYHEHRGDPTQRSLFGDQKLKIDQARYFVEFQLGWNLLHWTDLHNQMLTLSFVAAAAQLPFMPLEYDASTGDLPVLAKKQVSMPGAAVGYSWQTTSLGITLDGGFLQEKSDNVEMGYQRLVLDYFHNERLAVSLGFFNRFTQSVRCHSSSLTCLKEGKVTTSSEERGVYLGAGAAFF